MIDLAPPNPANTAAVALSLTLDVRDGPAVADAVERVEAELGAIDYLVTAAGHYRAASIAEPDEAELRRMLEVHVGGTANAWRAVVPRMRTRGRGAICAIGSELGIIGDPSAPHYAAAKGAIHAMTKSLAVELAPDGIRVNCVAPGPTDTPLLGDDPNMAGYAAALPLGRRSIAVAPHAPDLRTGLRRVRRDTGGDGQGLLQCRRPGSAHGGRSS